jgi:hypothetical protein
VRPPLRYTLWPATAALVEILAAVILSVAKDHCSWFCFRHLR